MAFAETYFKRFQTGKIQITENPENDLFLSIVIPSFNEDELCKSLQSLKDCTLPQKAVEVIVVINSSEDTTNDIIRKNEETYKKAVLFAKKNTTAKLKFFILNEADLPGKFAGVGLARKIGMDEALRRFNLLNRPNGLIAGFDADALLNKNYFTEIESYFNHFPKINACSINFEHPLGGNDYPEEIYKSIINYELHLRYFVEALRFANFPFAYHTIGSAFVVRADVYAKQGGMNRKKAGEDFYFLQKIIPLGNYGEINSTTVIPSPRKSDRVPFGTGAAISKMIENNTEDFGTYNFDLFLILKSFFLRTDSFYENFSFENSADILIDFFKMNAFEDALNNIKSNSPNVAVFKKRFFDWFNAFRVIKFLNFAHEKKYVRKNVFTEAEKLLKIYHPEIKIPDNEKDLLLLYRKIQKNTSYP